MTYRQSQANLQIARRRTSAGTYSPSYTVRISQRMTREEAVKAVVRMMSAYTNFRCSEESMLTLAEVLLQWPLETAMAAASPIHGAPQTYKDFPVTAGQLVEWCYRAAESLYAEARLERNTLRLAAPKPLPPTAAELERLRREYPQYFPVPGSKCVLREDLSIGKRRHGEDERREAQAILDSYAAAARQTQEDAA